MSNQGWAVVVADHGMAAVAEQKLGDIGYTADFLWYRKLADVQRVGGRLFRTKGEQAVVMRPLFLIYGFVLVDFDIDCTDIDRCTGVSRILRHPPKAGERAGRPKRIVSSIVERFREASAAGEFDDAKVKLRDVSTPGAKVRVLRGAGLVMTVKGLDDKGRLRYAMDLFGREIEGMFSKAEIKHLELVE